jgi:acyl-CoA thioesterase-1
MIRRTTALVLGVAIVATVTFFLGSANANAQVVALGASNTAGKGVGESAAYPAQLQAILRSRGSSMSVANAGISGDTTAGMLARLSSSVPQGTKIVILQFGGNDARKGVSPAERQANIAAIQTQLHARGIRTINADDLVRSALKSGMVQGDGIHLTEAGHQRVAAQLASSIR